MLLETATHVKQDQAKQTITILYHSSSKGTLAYVEHNSRIHRHGALKAKLPMLEKDCVTAFLVPHFACQTKPVAPKEFQADLTAAIIIAVIKTFSLFVDRHGPRLIFISSAVELEKECVALVVCISVPRTVANGIETHFIVTSVEYRGQIHLGIHILVCQLRVLDVALGTECNDRPFAFHCHSAKRKLSCETGTAAEPMPRATMSQTGYRCAGLLRIFPGGSTVPRPETH